MEEPSLTRRRCICGLLGLYASQALPWPTFAQSSGDASSRLLDVLEAQKQPGIAAVVVERGVVVARAVYGYRDDAYAFPVDDRTVFELGSVTKALTAMLVFRLRDAGALALDQPIGRYVDHLPEAWRPISLRRLLSHTSGIPNYLNEGNFIGLFPTNPLPRALLSMVAARPLDFEPGTRHAYSNTNYILAGLAIERAAGIGYWSFLASELLAPLRMADAGPRVRDDQRPIAQGHLFLDGKWIKPPPTAPGATWSAGGLLASLRDMERLAIGLDAGRILPATSLHDMWADTPLANGGTAGWSAGWEVVDAAQGIVGHGGGTAGFSAYLLHAPRQRRTTVVLVNRAGEIDNKGIALRADLATRSP